VYRCLHGCSLTFISALSVSKRDYCCSVLVGVSATQLQRLQSVLKAAARLVFTQSKNQLEHVTTLLRDLHWLKILNRIQFRICVLVKRCLHGRASSYLAETLHLSSDVEPRRCLRSGLTSTMCVPSPRRSTLGIKGIPGRCSERLKFAVIFYQSS